MTHYHLLYTKLCKTSKHYFTSNLLICCYFNMNAQINQTKPELYSQDSMSLSPVPETCSEGGVCGLAQLLHWACLYRQSSPDLLDLQSIHGDAHGCPISLCLHQILHRVTSLLEVLYFCLPCSHSQEEGKDGRHGFGPSCSVIMASVHPVPFRQ